MRPLLLLLTILIYSCSSKQEPNNTTNLDSATLHINATANYILKSTTDCCQKHVSQQFDLSINCLRFTDTIEKQDSVFLKIFLKDKTTKTSFDSIVVNPSPFFDFLFMSCDSMTSFSTKFKADREIVDNYFGDIVVADLNFDGKDDIAIINDGGGNGGSEYIYYIQTSNKKFVLETFLTDSVSYFPTKIDNTHKRLTTYVHAGACCVGEHIYQYDKTKNLWRQTSHKILGR